MKQKFLKCTHCGQMIAMVKETGVPIICCGEEMKEIIAGTSDAAVEKHVPIYSVANNIVKVYVGQIEHPMSIEHHIEWVSLQCKKGNQRKALPVSGKPYVEFFIEPDDQVETVYAYCNLHGLWKS